MKRPRTHNGRPGLTAEYFRRLEEARPSRRDTSCDEPRARLTEDDVRRIVRDELLAIFEEARQP